jgi:Holliday junction resolvasome RuvABC endonuclease subunit
MMAAPYIACFDAATSVGACDGPVGGRPRMVTWDLRRFEGRPQRLLALSDHLDAYFRATPVDYAFVEAPLAIAVMMEIGATTETVQLLRGIVAVIEVCAARARVPVGWWSVQEARKAVTGRATWPRGTAKTEVMKYCRMLGYDPSDDNQADALIGWLFESARLNPRIAHLTAPLFVGQRA